MAEKLRNRMAILSVSGEKVFTKHYPVGDTAIKKITENNELLWSVASNDEQTVTITFLRKEYLSSLLDELAANHIHIVEQRIMSEYVPLTDNETLEITDKYFHLSTLRHIPERLNLLCSLLFYRLRLPVLILLFLLLLGNFMLNERLRGENSALQTELQIRERTNKAQKETQERQGRIGAEYRKIPKVSFALLSDRIASYLPEGVRLSNLTVFPPISSGSLINRNKEVNISFNVVRLQGETTIPGSVTLLTQFLDSDELFSGVEIVSLQRQKESSLFRFELLIKLKL
jgi:hypothetical protein